MDIEKEKSLIKNLACHSSRLWCSKQYAVLFYAALANEKIDAADFDNAVDALMDNAAYHSGSDTWRYDYALGAKLNPQWCLYDIFALAKWEKPYGISGTPGHLCYQRHASKAIPIWRALLTICPDGSRYYELARQNPVIAGDWVKSYEHICGGGMHAELCDALQGASAETINA